jgi:hypothetical protein
MGLHRSRRLAAWLATATVLAATMAAGVAPASAAQAACRIEVDGAATFSSLQAAIDAAPVGGTLKIKGTCVGDAGIGTSLTIEGRGDATIVGSIDVRRRGVTTTVLISHLTITGRVADEGDVQQTTPLSVTTLQDVDMQSLAVGSRAKVILAGHSSVSGSAGNGVQVGFGGAELVLDDHASIDHHGGCGIAGTDASPVVLNDHAAVHHNEQCGVSLEGYEVILNDHASIHHNGGAGVFSGDEGRWATCNDRSTIHHNLYGIHTFRFDPARGCIPGDNVYKNVIADVFVRAP